MCLDETDMPAICNETDFDISSMTADMQAMVNLYNSSLVCIKCPPKDLIGNSANSSQFCSECFLELYRLRLLDPWLAPTNFTDYLIEQFDSVQNNCSTTLPYTTSSSTLYRGPQTIAPVTSAISVTTTTTYVPLPTSTCLGQLVQPISNWLTCNSLCDTYVAFLAYDR